MVTVWKITYTIKDAKNKQSRTRINIQHAETSLDDGWNDIETIEDIAHHFAPQIQALIGGVINKIHVTKEIQLPSGLETIPELDSDVEEVGLFNFSGDNNSQTTVSIPTIKDSILVPGTDLIDTDFNVDVVDFVFDMIDGSGSPAEYIRAVDARNNVVSGHIKSYKRFKSSGKRK